MRLLMKYGRRNIATIVLFMIILFLITLMWDFSRQLKKSITLITSLEHNVSQLMLKNSNTQVETTNSVPVIKDLIIPHNKYFNRGLQIDWWFDVCFERTTWDRTWHPLFPFFPQKTTTTFKAVEDERTVGNFLRRISGFIYTNSSEYFEFKLLSRDGAEVLLLDTGIALHKDSKPPLSLQSAKEILYLKLKQREMAIQDQKLSLQEMFFTEPARVWLESRRLYFVEIVQGGKHFARAQLHWKRLGDRDFQTIRKENLLYSDVVKLSRILEKSRLQEKYPVLEAEKRRNLFHKIPTLVSTKAIRRSSFTCEPTKRAPVVIKKLYEGYWHHVDSSMSYPKEYFDFKFPAKTNHLLIAESEAVDVAKKTFEKINQLHDRSLELQHIVHIQKNLNATSEPYKDWRKTLYFVEMDVKMKTDDGQLKTYRSSQYVQSSPDGICFVSDYEWKENVQINLITPIQNQKIWLLYLIQMLKELQEKTNEKNIKLILIDCGSTDGDYERILKASGLSHQYLWLELKDFSKVKALNYGLKHVKQNNSIAFVLDLHLQLPLNIFDRIRKYTIQGGVAFTPTLMKLACGEHEQYTQLKKTQWLDVGTGMIALYISDWNRVGGFNEVLYNNKWGGEDWELIDRIVGKGLRVVHYRMPRFYHIHHAREGAWYGSKKKTKA